MYFDRFLSEILHSLDRCDDYQQENKLIDSSFIQDLVSIQSELYTQKRVKQCFSFNSPSHLHDFS